MVARQAGRPSQDIVADLRRFAGRSENACRLSFSVTDLGWSHGDGPHVSGPANALALSLLGRPALVDQLDGPGLPALTQWPSR
jgi:hypothetical protein